MGNIIKGDDMQIRLGYVAISLTLGITASKTMTFSHYQKLKEDKAQRQIDIKINENFDNLEKILTYNYKNEVHFYRMSHNLIPLATHKSVLFDYIKPYEKKWKKIGNLIKKYHMRVDIHPDEYCVLNSPNINVLENSVKILAFGKEIFEAMGIFGQMVIHVGGAYNNKEEAIERFKTNFRKLDKEIQKMIILENDDKVFGVKDVLSICEELKIPMVLDYHHYLCYNDKEDINDYLPRIFKTWNKNELRPKMHFSSPKSFKEKRSHSEYIDACKFMEFLEILKQYNIDVDVMLECKAKDEALFRLVRELKYYTDYVFLDATTLVIS